MQKILRKESLSLSPETIRKLRFGDVRKALGGARLGWGASKKAGAEAELLSPGRVADLRGLHGLPQMPAAQGRRRSRQREAAECLSRGQGRSRGRAACRFSRSWIVTAAHSTSCTGVYDSLH